MAGHGNKVFVLPCNEKDDIVGRASIVSLAGGLKTLHIPLYPEQLIYDPKYGNSNAVASFLQPQPSVKAVLWIITGCFVLGDMAKKMMEWHELVNNKHGTETITVFLDCKEEVRRCIPHFLQDVANVYFISSNCMDIQHENRAFANLHSTLSRILQDQNSCTNFYQRPMINPYCQLPIFIQATMPTVVLIAFTVPPVTPVVSSDTVENANSIFNMCKDTTIPVASYNVMLIRLSRGFFADWKMLGRSLGVSEADMYAIWRDHAYSVTEQAMQMFRRWIEMNGSGATIGVLTRAIYETGSLYWNLLEIMYKYLSTLVNV